LINQRVALSMLRKLGYRVDVAGDGRQALEALERRHYSVVLMDCMMPVMDGFEATAAIRQGEKGRHTTIIAMTAYAMPGDKERCLAAGMDDYISKPVDWEQLRRVMTRWVEVRSNP
jgi:CheY-like chemotaxis protein